MKIHTRHVQYLIRAIVVLVAYNACAFFGAKLGFSNGATVAASIVFAFVAQLVLVKAIFEAYMRWNVRRAMLEPPERKS